MAGQGSGRLNVMFALELECQGRHSPRLPSQQRDEEASLCGGEVGEERSRQQAPTGE